jgi:hypothetical protein
MFLCTAALVALLWALERGGGLRWAAVAVLSAAALYTHYIAVFPLAAALGWALWQHAERRRELLLSSAGALLAFAPWIPEVGANALLHLAPELTPESAVRYTFRLLPGHPYETLPDVPGRPAVALLAVGLLTAAVTRLTLARATPMRLSPPLVLLGVVALATPAGLIVYSLLNTDTFETRYLIASLPPAALLLAAVTASAPGRWWIATSGAALVAIGAGGVATAFDQDHRRPPYNEAADWVEGRLDPGDAIAEVPLFLQPGPEHSVLDINLPDNQPVFDAIPVRLPSGRYGVRVDERAWEPVRRGAALFVVTPNVGGGLAVPPPPPGLRVRVADRRLFRGFIQVGVFEYRRA